MRILTRNISKFIFILIIFTLMAACNVTGPTQSTKATGSTPTPGPTPTPKPIPNPLVVCLGEEPNTLYPYGKPNKAARQVLQAIYDGPIDHRSYTFQSVILDELPTLGNGNALLQTVEVVPGQTVLDHTGKVTELDFGTFVRPSGCSSSDCAVAYDGSQLIMDQIVVLFNLRPGLEWADGTPLTAADSVFAYNLHAGPYSLNSKFKVERTLSYEAVTSSQTLWTGIPGFIDQDYQDSFWLPAPQHLWGELSPEELLTAEISSKTPPGYGPFEVVSWEEGQITLRKNANYFRSNEGLPLVDPLIFKFVGQDEAANLDLLLSGECDILDDSASQGMDLGDILNLQNEGHVFASWVNGNAWELINFGIQHQSYDDGYSMWAADRANFFGDERTRRAVAMCIDRETIVEEITIGLSDVMSTFIPPDHPLSNPDVSNYPFAPDAASSLLEEVGWLMRGDGIREARGVSDVLKGTLFSINYYHLDHPVSETIAQLAAQGLTECGIKVNLVSLPAEELYATGPEAIVFGRQFDLAQFSWQASDEPPCNLYLSEAIPGENLDTFPFSWGGWNLTGWGNDKYDSACMSARGSAPGAEGYLQSHYLAQEIFAEQLPIIPLFTYQNIVLARPDICGLEFDPTDGFSWNLENLGYGQLCK
ncbi:MAG: hypothetical protein E3J88_02055 [Anaerolineales bacterium]|nr:MAG: hypothetical protein E3J88_02055 [Anaerolineales bacterium]